MEKGPAPISAPAYAPSSAPTMPFLLFPIYVFASAPTYNSASAPAFVSAFLPTHISASASGKNKKTFHEWQILKNVKHMFCNKSQHTCDNWDKYLIIVFSLLIILQ